MPNKELVTLGRKYNTIALLADAAVIADAARKTKARFTNLAPSDVDAVVKGITAVKALVPKKKATRVDIKYWTEKEEAARDEANELLQDLDDGLKFVLPKLKGSGITRAAFNRGHIAENTDALVTHLTNIVDLVARIDGDLQRHMTRKGKMSQNLRNVLATLESADTMQRDGLRAAPLETEALHEAKGTLVNAIRNIQWSARICFRKDKKTLKLFATKFDKAPAKKKRKKKVVTKPLGDTTPKTRPA